MSCYNSTVPSSPPQNVIVTSVNPASLRVSWQLPSTINYNGPITGHVIRYTGGGTSDMMMNVNSTITHTISGLVAFVDYSVTVAAMNVNGTGVFSNPVVGRSGEDSELHIFVQRTILCNSKNHEKHLSKKCALIINYTVIWLKHKLYNNNTGTTLTVLYHHSK